MNITTLQPERIWYYFSEILTIPRPSKHEEKIVEYLLDFGKKHGLETLQDEIGNVLIRKNATKGREQAPSVCLQSHIDMVCEKNSDVDHDFFKDPIQAFIDEGWVKARGTTLGADDGIGVAAQLAILESKSIEHGPVECLFTVDEETGLTGAFGLKQGFLKSSILLNLDSEDEGELFFGCAGGKDTVATFKYETENVPDGFKCFKLEVKGLLGGHSGDDINKGRGNANKLINRILWTAHHDLQIKIAEIDGGNLRNAIAREARAVIFITESFADRFIEIVEEYSTNYKVEHGATEPHLKVECHPYKYNGEVLTERLQDKLLNAIYACPHGVIEMSKEIPDFVETSTNLASIKFTEERVLVTTSQRSSIESSKDDVANMVVSVFNLAGASTQHSDGYPGWKPNPNSPIIDITRKAYQRLFGSDPKVLAIHAGLECGLIGHTYPEMDMVSYGPTIRGAHSPDERIEIETVKKFWDLTLEVLKSV